MHNLTVNTKQISNDSHKHPPNYISVKLTESNL